MVKWSCAKQLLMEVEDILTNTHLINNAYSRRSPFITNDECLSIAMLCKALKSCNQQDTSAKFI